MLQKTRGIVLHTLKYSDTALIADIYTEVEGRVSFMVYVSRSKRSKVRPAVLQPLALVELEADLRPGVELQRVREARVAHPLPALPCDPRKATMALYLAEFLYRVLREQAGSPALFDYLWHSVICLDECHEGLANFHLVFLLHLLRFLGLSPNLDGFAPGTCFDLMAASFTVLPPRQHTHWLPAQETAHIPLLMRFNFRSMRFLRMNRADRARCLERIHEYYRLHLPGLPEMRSLDVLKEVFNN